jgi:hypothetical protein
MMFRRTVLLSCLGACAAALALAVSAGPSLAQQPAKEPAREAKLVREPKKIDESDRGPLPKDGTQKLEDDYSKEVRTLFRQMADGQLEPGKEQEPTIDIVAKWYTYRLTWNNIQTETNKISQLMSDLDGEFSHAAKAQNTQQFQHLFARALAKNARDVLNNRTAIARMNAARVLWRAAPTGEPDIAAALVDALADPEQDMGTKYWACKGLQEFLAPEGKMPPVTLKDQALQTRITLTLLAFLDTRFPFSASTPPEEIEGIRALRREAIHALALTQNPAVVEQGKLTGRTAQTLLRVVRKDGFVPAPGWGEQVEAAIGIGWMKSSLYPGYQPDYAVYNAAYGVVALAEKYAEDKTNGKAADHGWKYHSERLAEAFDNLVRDLAGNKQLGKDKELNAYVADVNKAVANVLKLAGSRGDVNPGDLEQWLENHPPKGDTVYKGVADSKVKPPEPGAEK